MSTIIATYGLPASGKTAWADWLVSTDPRLHRAFGRDRIRALLGTPLGRGRTTDDERRVTEKQREMVADWLERSPHAAAILDETSIGVSVQDLGRLREEVGADWLWIVDFSGVPLRVCLERNARRPRTTRVPYAEMRRMARALRPLPQLPPHAGMWARGKDRDCDRSSETWWTGDLVRDVERGVLGVVLDGNEHNGDNRVNVFYEDGTGEGLDSRLRDGYWTIPELELVADQNSRRWAQPTWAR